MPFTASETSFKARLKHRHEEVDMHLAQVLICASVLVGRSCKGSPSHVEPPLDPQGEPYDTTVDDVEKPSIFVPSPPSLHVEVMYVRL